MERDPVTHLRLPAEVREALRLAALMQERSMNALLVRYARRGLETDGVPIRQRKEKRPDGATRLGVGVTSPLDQERKRTRGY
jgi:hypothetical protein